MLADIHYMTSPIIYKEMVFIIFLSSDETITRLIWLFQTQNTPEKKNDLICVTSFYSQRVWKLVKFVTFHYVNIWARRQFTNGSKDWEEKGKYKGNSISGTKLA
jgi:hypothetical protein